MKNIIFVFILLSSFSSHANTCEDYFDFPRIKLVEQLSEEQYEALESLARLELDIRSENNPHLKRSKFFELEDLLEKLMESGIDIEVYRKILNESLRAASSKDVVREEKLANQNKRNQKALDLELEIMEKFRTFHSFQASNLTEALFWLFVRSQFKDKARGTNPQEYQDYIDKIFAEPMLIERLDAKAVDTLQNTLLHHAALTGPLYAVEALVNIGANIHALNHHRDTPLHISAVSKNSQVTKFLIQQGADIDAQNKTGSTPLHYSTLNHSPKIANILINRGAKVNLQDQSKRTPLRRALDNANPQTAKIIINLLLKHGADPEIKDGENNTPLRYAANNRFFSAAKLLVDHGAKLTSLPLTKLDQGLLLISRHAFLKDRGQLKKNSFKLKSRTTPSGTTDTLKNEAEE